MKQKYMKPALVMERFELSQSIASGCNVTSGGNSLGRPIHWSKETCGWFIEDGFVLWLEKNNTCTEHIGENEDSGFGVCYNNPAAGQTIFSS